MLDFDEKKISDRIRNLRIEKGFTLDRLASITGLTKGYLSRIENSDKSPPFSTLTKIASALNTDIISFLFDENEGSSGTNLDIVRAESRREIGRRFAPEAYGYESLAYRMRGKNMEPMLVTMDEKAPIVEFHHEGEEFIYILEGKLEFYYEGETYVLEPGDSIYFNSGVSHSGRSLGEDPVRFLCIIYPYKRI